MRKYFMVAVTLAAVGFFLLVKAHADTPVETCAWPHVCAVSR